MTALSEVETVRAQLITSVRSFIEGHLETWRLVPLLALQADGRDGGMGHYSYAYKSGMWELHIANDNLHHVFVDCETGAVMFLSFQPNEVFCPVNDDTIVRLANHLGDLDAKEVVSSLHSRIQRSLPSWISPEQAGERETERARIQRQLNLAERYVRPNIKAAA